MEQVHTSEIDPGHDDDCEKNALRNKGDERDHAHETRMTISKLMSLAAMSFRECGVSSENNIESIHLTQDVSLDG